MDLLNGIARLQARLSPRSFERFELEIGGPDWRLFTTALNEQELLVSFLWETVTGERKLILNRSELYALQAWRWEAFERRDQLVAAWAVDGTVPIYRHAA